MAPTLKALMNWGTSQLNPISTSMDDTTAINHPPLVTLIAAGTGSHLGAKSTGVTALAIKWATTARDKETQEPLPTERRSVVLPKKKKPRKGVILKITMFWRNFTFSCVYSDWLTPAILLEDIGKEPLVTLGALIKATLTPRHDPSDTLNFEVPLSQQGIIQGNTLRILVLHAKIHDPYEILHLVSYREDDVIKHFLTALIDNSAIPSLYDCDIYHGESLLNPATSRVLDYTLPNEPTLHVRFRGNLDVPPAGGAGISDPPGAAADQTDGPGPSQANIPAEPQTEPLQTDIMGGGHVTFSQEFPNQVLVQDPRGKTHALLFCPRDSITGNPKRHTLQLYLPPPAEFYILWVRRIILADLTGAENGLQTTPEDPPPRQRWNERRNLRLYARGLGH